MQFKTPYYYPQHFNNMGVPAPRPTMTRAKWGFDDEAPHSAIKRTRTHPGGSPEIPRKVYDRGRSVSFSDVGGLLRNEGSPGRGRRSGGSDSASGSASESASGSGSWDSVVIKMPPDDMMFNDVGGLLTVFEEV